MGPALGDRFEAPARPDGRRSRGVRDSLGQTVYTLDGAVMYRRVTVDDRGVVVRLRLFLLTGDAAGAVAEAAPYLFDRLGPPDDAGPGRLSWSRGGVVQSVSVDSPVGGLARPPPRVAPLPRRHAPPPRPRLHRPRLVRPLPRAVPAADATPSEGVPPRDASAPDALDRFREATAQLGRPLAGGPLGTPLRSTEATSAELGTAVYDGGLTVRTDADGAARTVEVLEPAADPFARVAELEPRLVDWLGPATDADHGYSVWESGGSTTTVATAADDIEGPGGVRMTRTLD